MKCEFDVDDGGDGQCSKNIVKKYKIDGESHFCRFHHYVYLSVSYAKRIEDLQEEIDLLVGKYEEAQLPQPVVDTFNFNILDKTPPITLSLRRYTNRKEKWLLSGNGPANEAISFSVSNNIIKESTTSPNGEWFFELQDWHIPANAKEGTIRIIFPRLHTDEGKTYIIKYNINKVGEIQKNLSEKEHKHRPIRIKTSPTRTSIICETCGVWLKNAVDAGADPQY